MATKIVVSCQITRRGTARHFFW